MTPWTQLAYQLALAKVSQTPSFLDAYTAARAELDALWSCNGGLAVTEANAVPATQPPPAGASPADVYAGVLAAGLSEMAARYSVTARYTPGRVISGWDMLQALARDVGADGVFDGSATGSTPIAIQGFILTPDTLGADPSGLPQSVAIFLQSPANQSGLSITDVADALQCLVSTTGGHQDALDLTGPDIRLDVAPGATISETVSLCATVSDPSGVAAASFSSPVPAGTLSSNDLCTNFDTTTVPDGDLAITVVAADALGNSTTTTVTVRVDNGGPTITLVSPPADSTVTGTVTLTVQASDADGVQAVTLVSPLALSSVSAGTHLYALTLPTAELPDGDTSFTVRAVDSLGRAAEQSFHFLVDNAEPTILQGCAFLDSPVVGATAALVPVGLDGKGGAVIGSTTTNTDGCFTLTVPDTVSGWIRVRVTGGTYLAAGTGLAVSLGAFSGLTASLEYAPSRPAIPITDVSVNPYTSLADRWAIATVAQGGSLDSLALAYDLFANHLGQGAPFDILHTYARDFLGTSAHASLTSDAATRLGLAGLGLGQFGADVALHNGLPTSGLSSLDVLRALYTDAGNTVFDGLDANGAAVTLSATIFDSQVLRSDLATSIAHWLDSPRNVSGLTKDNYSQPGGFLSGIAQDGEPLLFGNTPPLPFDTTPPALSVGFYKNGNTLVPTGTPLAGDALAVVASASDFSGFGSVALSVSLQGGDPTSALGYNTLPPPDAGATTAQASYPLRTTRLSDGPHALVVRSTDSLGNSTGDVFYGFTSDNTPPTLTITTPALVSSASVKLEWALSDATTSVTTLAFTVDGAAQAPISNPDASGSLTVPLGTCDKTVSWQAVATDAAGNTTTKNGTFTCDASGPSLTVMAPALVASKTAIFGWTVSDSTTSVTELAFTVAGIAQTPLSNPDPDGSATYGFSACDASIAWQAVATDAAGHTTVKTGSIVCDATAPSLSVSVPTSVTSSSATFAWAVSDNPGPVTSLVFTVSDVAQPAIPNPGSSGSVILSLGACDRTVAWSAAATDAAGNTATKTGSIACDASAPTLDVTPPTTVATRSASFSWHVTDNPGPVTSLLFTVGGIAQSAISNPVTDGSATFELITCDTTLAWQAVATDAAGHTTTKNGTFKCDETPPSLTVTAPATVTSPNASFGWSVSDTVGPVKSLVFTVGTTAQAPILNPEAAGSVMLQLGTCNTSIAWSAVATDAAGHATTKSGSILCDSVAPTLGVTTPLLVPSRSVTLSWDLSDPGGPVASLSVTVGGVAQTAIANPPASGASTVALASCDATITWQAMAVDLAGNSTSQSGSFKCDETPPTLTVAPPAIVKALSATFQWNVSDTVGPVTSLLFTVGGVAQSPITDPVASGTNTYTLPACNGTVSWSAVATDAASHSRTQSGTFTCDNTPPSLSVSAPSPVTAQSASFSWTASDNLGPVTSIQFTIGGVAQPAINNPPANGSMSYSLNACDASYTWQAVATDAAGNTTSQTGSVTCDATPPSLTVTAPALVSLRSATFSYNVSDVAGPVTSLVFTIGGVAQMPITNPNTSDTAAYGLSSCDTTIAWSAAATDAAGRTTYKSGSFKCDETPPQLEVTAPNIVGASRSAIFGYSLDDTVGPVASLVFTLGGVVQPAIVNPPSDGVATYTLSTCNAKTTWSAVATDAAGHTTASNGEVVCDSLPPTLSVTAPSLVGTPSATFNYAVSDSPGPVTSLVFTVGGVVESAIASPPATGLVTYALPFCNAAVTWSAKATDAAGNITTETGTVNCDANSPTVEIITSTYLSDELGNFSITLTAMSRVKKDNIDFTTDQPQTLYKLRNLYWDGEQDMPKLTIQVGDAGNISTPAGSLSLEYQYQEQASATSGWVVQRDWTPVMDGLATRTLVLSDTNLSASILNSTAAKLHRLAFRVTDAAGHTGTTQFDFRLVFIAVPVVVDQCDISRQGIGATDLQRMNLANSYSGSATQMWVGKMRWPFNAAGNFTPQNLIVNLDGAVATSRIYKTHLHKTAKSSSLTYNNPSTTSWAMSYYPVCSATLDPPYSMTACPDDPTVFPGTTTPSDCTWTSCPGLSDDVTHSMAFAGITGATFAMTYDTTYDVIAQAQNSLLYIGGNVFTWGLSADQSSYVTGATKKWYDMAGENAKKTYDGYYEYTTYGYGVSYETRISEFHVDVTPVIVTAQDPANPGDTQNIYLLGNCAKNLRYITTPTASPTVTPY